MTVAKWVASKATWMAETKDFESDITSAEKLVDETDE